MRITSVTCSFINDGSRNWPIVQVGTDADVTGIGEAYPVGPDKAVAETVRYFEEWLLGFDPFDGERIWHELYAGSRFPTGSVITSAIYFAVTCARAYKTFEACARTLLQTC